MNPALNWMTNGEDDYLQFDTERGRTHYLPITGSREVFLALMARCFSEIPVAPRDAKRSHAFAGEFETILEIEPDNVVSDDPAKISDRIEAILGRDVITSILRGDEDVTLTPRVAELVKA
jgi:hypothetical protein